MDAQELLGKVRKIEIRARGLSRNVFAGEYHSAFRGRGMAFSEVREYQYGDDVRDIDWNVTARLHRPYVKLFEEERELTVMLLVDVSGSLDFGTTQQTKRDMATEMAATLAFSAIQNNDKIGVIFFSDKIEKFIPPKKGRKHILYIIRELLDFKPESQRTDISGAVEYLTRAIKRRCTAFLLSDFLDKKDFRQALTIANRKHDMVAIQVAHKEQHRHIHNVIMTCRSIFGNFDTTVHRIVCYSWHLYIEVLAINLQHLSETRRAFWLNHIVRMRQTTWLGYIPTFFCCWIWHKGR